MTLTDCIRAETEEGCSLPLHLLFPLFSSVVFVFGMMLSKKAIDGGASPWTGTFLANFWLCCIWLTIAAFRGQVAPMEAWPYAAVIGVMFVLGQVFTFLAFQFGDVSVATPVFGVKVLMVAGLVSVMTDMAVSSRIWLAGGLATAGIVMIQTTGQRGSTRQQKNRVLLTILLASTAAFCLSLFDVLLQKWAADYNSYDFLPVMFTSAALLSIFVLPWVDRPSRIRELKLQKWIVGGTLLMALQALSMTFSLAEFSDAPRINIVYSLRGLWGVLLAWAFSRALASNESDLARSVMLQRLGGAVLLTSAVIWVIQK